MDRRRTEIAIGLIGAGRIGAAHAQILAEHVPGARLAVVADPRPGAGAGLADRYDANAVTDAYGSSAHLTSRRSSSRLLQAHTELISLPPPPASRSSVRSRVDDAARHGRCAGGGRLSRRAVAGGLQPAIRPDFRAAHDTIAAGAVGTPQLMRSLTRDPGLANPAGVPPWTIFLQTLIHDFDTVLWLNPGASRSRSTPPRTRWSRPTSRTPVCSTPRSW